MQNSIYKIKYLLFLPWDWEAWFLTQSGGNAPPLKEKLLEIRGENFFHCLEEPNNLIRPCWTFITRRLSTMSVQKHLLPPGTTSLKPHKTRKQGSE